MPLLAAIFMAVCGPSPFADRVEAAGLPSDRPAASLPASPQVDVAAQAAEPEMELRLDRPTPAYPAVTPASGRTFVALGDSLTAWAFAPGSWRASTSGVWPSVLSDLDPDLRLVHNAGVPGDTTAGMLSRLRREVLAHHPDVLFVLGGTNDVGYHWPSSVTVRNLRTIVRSARGNGIEVALLTMPPNNKFSPAERRLLRATNAALVKMGADEGVVVVDLYSALAGPNGALPAPYAAADRLHLTPAAESAIAQTVYETLNRAAIEAR